MSTLTDAKLLSLVKEGNKEAFDCIYKKYWHILLDEAYKRLKSKEESEEIVQELFIHLWCKRQEIHLTHSFSTYISVALKYRIFNHIRKKITEEKHLEFIRMNEPHYSEMVEERILYNDLHSAYKKEIENLPERCREIYNLRREENLSFKEIAEKLDISVNTVDKQLGKALKRLREKLKDYHFSPPFLYIDIVAFMSLIEIAFQ